MWQLIDNQLTYNVTLTAIDTLAVKLDMTIWQFEYKNLKMRKKPKNKRKKWKRQT